MKKRFMLAISLLAFALLSWNFSGALANHATHQTGAPRRGASSLSSSGSSTDSVRSDSARKLAMPPLRDTVQLPPEEVAFSTSYSELKRLADAGSPRAACRLAFERREIELHHILGVRTDSEGGMGMPLRPDWGV
jgi:hypothetical protein